MKGNERLLAVLNDLLREELTAISQYVVHSEMCANWGYDRLHEAIEKRAIQEMKHAESLISRIIFLEGIPEVSKLNKVQIGATVPDQLKSDLEAELMAVRAYNDAIILANEVKDAVTRELLESIVKDEDAHVDWLEEQLDQIQQMGLQVYLSTQVDE